MTTMEENKSGDLGTGGETPQFSQSSSRLKLSTMSILNAIGSRFFSKGQEESARATEKSETTSVHSNKSNKSHQSTRSHQSSKSHQSNKSHQSHQSSKSHQSNKSHQSTKSIKPKQETQEQTEEKPKTVLKEKKSIQLRKKPDSQLEIRNKLERDFRRFRSKYNNGLGNIVRSWMNLIYCVLILRMNVVKLILQRIQENNPEDFELEQQIRFESKIIYNMIREAQNYSQERSLLLWNHLEKLIVSRAVIRSALEEVQDKEGVLKDWKGTAAKLEQVKREANRLKAEADAIMKMKAKTDEDTKERLAELEAVEEAKDQELKQLLHQISEMKRKEVKLRGKILLNMKNYKDLKTKKENLQNIEKELMQLKNDQVTATKEYTNKIEVLKSEIEEKEKLIKAEKDEKRKLKANLKGLGDQSLSSIIKEERVPS